MRISNEAGDGAGQTLDEMALAWAAVAPAMRLVAQVILRSAEDVEDALQGATLRILRDAEKRRPMRSLAALLVAAARREAQTIVRAGLRRKRRVTLMAEAFWEAQVTSVLAMSIEGEQVVAAIAHALDPPARAWLRDVLSGAADAEVAWRDRVSEAAVRKRRSRLQGMVLRILAQREILELLGHNERRAATSEVSEVVAQPSTLNHQPSTQTLER